MSKASARALGLTVCKEKVYETLLSRSVCFAASYGCSPSSSSSGAFTHSHYRGGFYRFVSLVQLHFDWRGGVRRDRKKKGIKATLKHD